MPGAPGWNGGCAFAGVPYAIRARTAARTRPILRNIRISTWSGGVVPYGHAMPSGAGRVTAERSPANDDQNAGHPIGAGAAPATARRPLHVTQRTSRLCAARTGVQI